MEAGGKNFRIALRFTSARVRRFQESVRLGTGMRILGRALVAPEERATHAERKACAELFSLQIKPFS